MARVKRGAGPPAEVPLNIGLDVPQEMDLSASHEDFFMQWRKHIKREDISCYVYRLWPIIDRGRVGIKEKYIDVVPGSNLDFGESWLKRAHGSGKYRLLMVRIKPR